MRGGEVSGRQSRETTQDLRFVRQRAATSRRAASGSIPCADESEVTLFDLYSFRYALCAMRYAVLIRVQWSFCCLLPHAP